MVGVKFFLDTNALIYLSGLEDLDLCDFKSRRDASNSELSTIHVSIDEITKHIKFHEPIKKKHEKKVQSYQQKIDEALKTLKSKGITVRIEATKIPVTGIARAGYVRTASKEIGKLYDELRKEIDKCMKSKGNLRWLSKTEKERVLNIARDAVIAVSSIGHDFFITCDRCLSESWKKVIGKYSMLKQRYKLPRVICARPTPKTVAKQMLKVLP